MKRVVEKIDNVWSKLYKVKTDKVKKTTLDIILTLSIIPLILIMLVFRMNAVLFLFTYNFNIKFFLEVICASILLYVIIKMVKVLIFLNGEDE